MKECKVGDLIRLNYDLCVFKNVHGWDMLTLVKGTIAVIIDERSSSAYPLKGERIQLICTTGDDTFIIPKTIASHHHITLLDEECL